jgi:hypothetical protein
LQGIGVESAEIPKEMVHSIRAEAIVVDEGLIRTAAAHSNAGRRFVAPGNSGQQLKGAEDILFT